MKGNCYICGCSGAVTKDHVFPQGLFPPPLPTDMLTAPACDACQQRLHLDEEYFRTVAASGAYRDPSARELWDTKIVRSFSNSPAFRLSLANAIRTVEWKTPGGIIRGEVTGIEGDQVRVGNVLRKIVRGLFYLDTARTVMPFDVKFSFELVSPLTRRPMEPEVMDLFRDMPLRTVGEVVKYKFGFWPELPRLTLTWMAFYGRTIYVVWTGPDPVVPMPEEASSSA
jgi:hypothetical protein